MSTTAARGGTTSGLVRIGAAVVLAAAPSGSLA
jgi:hypothetical protein